MIRINVKDNYFEYIRNNPNRTIVVYGAGETARKNYKFLGHIDFFCDQRAKSIDRIEDIQCLLPEELENIHNELIILISIENRSVVDEVCSKLSDLQIDAEVFLYYKSFASASFDASGYSYICNPKDKLKICIVYINDGWIFGKFANKLKGELIKLGHEAYIAEKEDTTADINHYIQNSRLRKFCTPSNTVRTTMISHIDCLLKLDLIKYQARHDILGICMSADTMNKLVSWGVPRNKICYVNPAQDGEIKPKKIVLGITNRCYHTLDFRKRDDLILKVCEHLDADFFKLKIMGAGWTEIVNQIRHLGFEVEYYDDFDKEIYKELILSLDYWMYYGFDEGAMGYLDAMAAGVKTIATPQGFHLDTKYKVTFPCSTIDDFIKVLLQIQNDKREIIDSVKDWTWDNYAKKHLEIWHYLTRTKPLKDLYVHQSEYMDGIFSMMISNNRVAD